MSAIVIGMTALAGCSGPQPSDDRSDRRHPDKGDMGKGRIAPPFKDVDLYNAYEYNFTVRRKKDTFSTTDGEYKLLNITAVEPSGTGHVVRAFKALVGPKTRVEIGEDSAIIVHEGWIYLWGKWPRARTERVSAVSKGSSFGVYVANDATHVLWVSGKETDVEKFDASGNSISTVTLKSPPYIELKHDSSRNEVPGPIPTGSTALAQAIKDMLEQCDILVGQDP